MLGRKPSSGPQTMPPKSSIQSITSSTEAVDQLLTDTSATQARRWASQAWTLTPFRLAIVTLTGCSKKLRRRYNEGRVCLGAGAFCRAGSNSTEGPASSRPSLDRCQASEKSFPFMYFRPVSLATVTTVLPCPNSLAKRIAAVTLRPVDVPTSNPSSRANW